MEKDSLSMKICCGSSKLLLPTLRQTFQNIPVLVRRAVPSWDRFFPRRLSERLLSDCSSESVAETLPPLDLRREKDYIRCVPKSSCVEFAPSLHRDAVAALTEELELLPERFVFVQWLPILLVSASVFFQAFLQDLRLPPPLCSFEMEALSFLMVNIVLA